MAAELHLTLPPKVLHLTLHSLLKSLLPTLSSFTYICISYPINHLPVAVRKKLPPQVKRNPLHAPEWTASASLYDLVKLYLDVAAPAYTH